MLYSNSKRVDLERMSAETLSLKDRVLGYQETIKSLQGSLKSTEKARQKETYEATIAEKDAIIKELKNQLTHASAAERNGTNTDIPTAATPLNKKKAIPNTRRGSDKPRGGQPGHERHTLPGFDGNEITDSKGLDGLLEDDILPALTKETTVMHDHNKVNYNECFSFENIECNQHLERDIQRVADDNPDHT